MKKIKVFIFVKTSMTMIESFKTSIEKKLEIFNIIDEFRDNL